MSRIFKLFKHPIKTINGKINSNFIKKYSYLNDEDFIKKYFRRIFHRSLDLNHPRTFNEKLQWLKLFDRNPLYTRLVDKVAVRDYVANIIGDNYLIPCYGVWNEPEEIDFESLPNKFVLKCNHNSGLGMYICTNKVTIDISLVKENLKKGLSEDFYLYGREWPYKDVPRKIICEKFLEDGSGTELMDYKLFCFDGKFKVLLICSDRHSKLSNDWYDASFHHLPCINGPKNRKKPIFISEKINEMIKLAEKLSIGIPQCRVDFYDVNGRIYFGEITLFESSGFAPFKPKKYDNLFGDLITLPLKDIKK